MMTGVLLGFSVSLVVEWQIPILLARVRFPDGELFLPINYNLISSPTYYYYNLLLWIAVKSADTSSVGHAKNKTVFSCTFEKIEKHANFSSKVSVKKERSATFIILPNKIKSRKSNVTISNLLFRRDKFTKKKYSSMNNSFPNKKRNNISTSNKERNSKKDKSHYHGWICLITHNIKKSK